MGSNLTNNPDIAALSSQLSDIQAACLMAMQKADDLGTEIKELEARSAYFDASMAEGQRLAFETLRSAELRVANINAARDRLIIPQRRLIASIEEEIDELSDILASLTGDTGENETDKSQISADNIEFLASSTYKKVLREKYDYRILPALDKQQETNSTMAAAATAVPSPVSTGELLVKPLEARADESWLAEELQDKTAAAEMEAAMPAADFSAGPGELPEDIMAAAYDIIATINAGQNQGEDAGTETEQCEEIMDAADENGPAGEPQMKQLEEIMMAADGIGPTEGLEMGLQEAIMLAADGPVPAKGPAIEQYVDTMDAAGETRPTAELEMEQREEIMMAADEAEPTEEPAMEQLEEPMLTADEAESAAEAEVEQLEDIMITADETGTAAEPQMVQLVETMLAVDETGTVTEPEVELHQEIMITADEIGPAAEPEIERHEQPVAPASDATKADRASLPLRMSAVKADKKEPPRSSQSAAKRSLPQRLHKLVPDEGPPHVKDTGTAPETAAAATPAVQAIAADAIVQVQKHAANETAPAQKTVAAAAAPVQKTVAAATPPAQKTIAEATPPSREKEPAAALLQEPGAGEAIAVPELHLTSVDDSDPSLLGLDMPLQFTFYAGEDRQPQALRCHEWLIKMIIKIPEDNFQFVPDGDGARDIQSILLRYNQAVLNDMHPFDIVTPSRPNIGMYFYNCLEDNLSTMHLLLREISIWENNSQLLKVNYRNKVLDELLKHNDG